MNKCFFIGKVLNEPCFDFLYLKNNISMCYFSLEIDNKTTIKIYGVDEIADYIYQKIYTGTYVCIEGIICSNNNDFSAQITYIETLKK